MFLSIATTHQPATDLGYLLMKHPDRVHELDLGFGRAFTFFPEAHDGRCEAVLMIDVDPIALVRGRGASDGLLDQYVNDRPYAASSFLSVALNRMFRTAMAGTSRERQDLADRAIPIGIVVQPLPIEGSGSLVAALFEPLGWSVGVDLVPGQEERSGYARVRLDGELRLADALSHLYVLLPVLDDEKHYWVGEDEVAKLLAKAGAWLSAHPDRELITRRYLKGRRDLVRTALARLAPDAVADRGSAATPEEMIETPVRLNEIRLEAVARGLAAAGASIVADLGCGEGKLLAILMRDKRYAKLIGLDVSSRSLDKAADRLKLGRPGRGPPDDRVVLLHGALTYRDARWHEAEAVALVEVIEHLDEDRLAALEAAVFGAGRPRTAIVTTPNAEFNIVFPTLAAGAFRHPDHRFEWTRAEMWTWAHRVADQYGYRVTLSGIGDPHPDVGTPTQMAVFSR